VLVRNVVAAAMLAALGCGIEPAASSDVRDSGSNYVVRLEQMERIEAGEGEVIHLLRGDHHGFSALSFILTETAPGGGPPVHRHSSEEAHVLSSGRMTYLLDGQEFVAEAPYVVRIPAGTPHTFVNSGDSMLNLTAVFATPSYDYEGLGPNPLQGRHADQ